MFCFSLSPTRTIRGLGESPRKVQYQKQCGHGRVTGRVGSSFLTSKLRACTDVDVYDTRM